MQDRERDLIVRLTDALSESLEGEDCDHEVGICYCSLFSLLDDAKAYLDPDFAMHLAEQEQMYRLWELEPDSEELEAAGAIYDRAWFSIETDGGIVTECLDVVVDGTPGYAVHGDPDEGFYDALSVTKLVDPE